MSVFLVPPSFLSFPRHSFRTIGHKFCPQFTHFLLTFTVSAEPRLETRQGGWGGSFHFFPSSLPFFFSRYFDPHHHCCVRAWFFFPLPFVVLHDSVPPKTGTIPMGSPFLLLAYSKRSGLRFICWPLASFIFRCRKPSSLLFFGVYCNFPSLKPSFFFLKYAPGPTLTMTVQVPPLKHFRAVSPMCPSRSIVCVFPSDFGWVFVLINIVLLRSSSGIRPPCAFPTIVRQPFFRRVVMFNPSSFPSQRNQAYPFVAVFRCFFLLFFFRSLVHLSQAVVPNLFPILC